MSDITRKKLCTELRKLGWQPVEFDLIGGDYWHRPPHGLHVPLVNYATHRKALAEIKKATKKQDEEV